MAKFSPTEAVFAGVRFAKARPATILIWSAYLLVVLAVASIAMFDIGGDSMTALVIAAQGANPDPAQLMKLMQDVGPASLFAGLLITVFGAVLSAAILRVRLTPGPHPWAGLRLGEDELRLLGATLLSVAVVLALELVLGLVAGLAAGVGVPPIVALIPGLLLILAAQVRLSLAGVVSQAERKVSIPRAVRLTRKGFWRLLGAYVLLAAVALVALFLLTVMFAFLMGAAAMAMGGGVNQLALVLQGHFAGLNPLLLLLYIASNLAQVWLAVVVLCVFHSIGVDAYRAALSESDPS
jgi:hypothetical protein